MNIDGIAVNESNTVSPRSFNSEPYENKPLSYFQFKNKIDRVNMQQKTTDEYIAEYQLHLSNYKKGC